MNDSNNRYEEDSSTNHADGYGEFGETPTDDYKINKKYKDVEAGVLDTKKADLKREIFSWVRSLAIVALISFIFLKVFTNASIPSGSMETTIMTHDRLFGYNLAYLTSKPKRGDIIIFYMPDEPHEIYIKRVIGIEHDTIDFQEGVDEDGNSCVKVLLNKEVIDEPYLNEPMTEFSDLDLHFEVPEDSVFVMGDNRNDSYDARYWTNNYVSKDDIIAKAVFRYWPLNKMGVVK